MAYEHGVRVLEAATGLTAPIEGTAGLQVVFGTCPVNLAKDPYHVTNTPVLVNTFAEASEKLGYSAELDEKGHFAYTACASMYASFQLNAVAPLVFVNVLDPATHKKKNPVTTVPVADGEALVPITGILPDTVKVQAGGAGTDGAAMPAETAGVCDLTSGFKGKNYADMVSGDTKVLADGSVVGAIAYLSDYTGFSVSPEKQKGYYFPLHLGSAYQGKTVKVKRTSGTDGQEHKAQDTDWVLLLTDGAETAYQITVDGEEGPAELNISFAKATLLKEGAALDLTEGADYVLAFNDEGGLKVTFTDEKTAPANIAVESTRIAPDMVQESDVIGGASGGQEKGLEVLRQVYPKFGMTPGLILAPGWSHRPNVAMVMQAKCEEINGYFRAETFIDVNSFSEGGCTDYSEVKQMKEDSGINSPHAMALWPCVAAGSVKLWYSALAGAVQAYLDASNDDVPNLSISNKLASVTATVLADAVATTDENGVTTWDKEVILDQLQANVVNGYGVTTALNNNGWRTWGNRSACYPSITDPKDAWFCCRRFFSWWGNTFILTYAQKVDEPANQRLIQDIVDSENIRGAALVAAGKCAGASVEYLESENPVTNILNGQISFHTHLAPYIPAEDIVNTLEFDPTALQTALGGE